MDCLNINLKAHLPQWTTGRHRRAEHAFFTTHLHAIMCTTTLTEITY